MTFVIRTQKISDEKHRITSYHPHPEKLDEEQKKGTYEVDEMPKKEKKVGKSGKYYFNPETNEVWVEYEDRPLREEEMELEEVKEQFREEGRQEIRDKIGELDLDSEAKEKLKDI